MYRKRLHRPKPEGNTYDYPAEIPKLRRKIIIIDYDFGEVIKEIELYRTNRIDCYKAVVNGSVWKDRIGWAKVLESIRKSFTRVLSPLT